MNTKRWYNQNKDSLKKNFRIIDCIKKNQIKVSSILEIGCANGFQLDFYGTELKNKGLKKNLYGIDISNIAIKEGKKKYPKLNLYNIDSLKISKLNKKFDLVICGFFLYYIKRENIFEQFDQIIKNLKKNAYLIIHDFNPLFPHYNIHKKDKHDVFKVNYTNFLTSSHMFKLIDYSEYEINDPNYLSKTRGISLFKLIDFKKNFPSKI